MNTIQINPDVPFGTPTHVNLLALLLRQHRAHEHKASMGAWVMCECTPQITRKLVDYQQHVAEVLMQRLVDQVELECRIVQADRDRAAGLLCGAISAVGSQCSLVADHAGNHRSVFGSQWNDESDRLTGQVIAQQMEGKRD